MVDLLYTLFSNSNFELNFFYLLLVIVLAYRKKFEHLSLLEAF